MKDLSLLDMHPGLPAIEFPTPPNLPSLPDIHDSDPSDQTADAAPKDAAPEAPSKKKERYQDGPLGRIQVHGMKVKRKGKKLELSSCHQCLIYMGHVEHKDGRKFNLECESEEEAISWLESLVYGGAQRNEGVSVSTLLFIE